MNATALHRLARGAGRLLALPLIWLVQLYRLTLSPFVGQHCRFTPTCSQYAIEALEKHGAVRGSLLAAHRLGRCHPWCEGGYDPVPPADDEPPAGH
ncbi:MAG: membrane protein insertion efficiency factor YidD [Gammaproteobacteria bacterium]